ncbi:MAG: hypothetical protein ACKVZH_14315 [Blastocatellia bacterium]
MAKTRVSSSFFRSICFTLCLALSLSGLPFPASTQVSLQPAQGGLRTEGPPSPNLPDLDTTRNTKEAEPKAPADKPAKRCRWADTKCKKEKEKIAENLNPSAIPNPSGSGFDTNGERLFASAGNFDLWTWRKDTLAERLLSLPFNSFSPDDIKPVHDSPTTNKSFAASSTVAAAVQSISYNDIMTARVDAKYRTGTGGEDLFSGNYNWSLPIMGFPGRSGHDLGLSLSYNSTMWIRVGNTMVFDPDFNSASISPGFTLGFPTLAGPYVNTQSNKNCYQLLLPSGRVIELRQLSASVFESGDSSFTRLTLEASGYRTVRTTDGTQFKYQNLTECIEIKDRNGNLITATYNAYGQIETITDTLGRIFQLNYDGFQLLSSITFGTKLIATFGYVNNTLYTNFRDDPTPQVPNPPPLSFYNVSNGMTYPVLSQVYLQKDNSTYIFEPSTYGQVYEIRHVPAGLERSKVRYNLPLTAANFPSQPDCPRFTQRTNTAYEWNTTGVNTLFQIAPVSTAVGADICGQVTAPDGTVYKEFAWGAGWQKGLVKETQTISASTLQKKTETIWDQDVYTTYQNNPRAIESKVIDVANGNKTRRTVIGYTSYNLPADVYEYDYNQTTLLRRSHTDYIHYTTQRIIGLPSAQMLYDGSNALKSKVTYSYDDAGLLQNLSPSPIKHDTANYGLSFLSGRGNLTKVRRYDVNDTSGATFVESQTGYYISGSPALTRDALNHQTNIFYTDNFSNVSNSNTYAYPTQVQDPDGYWSYIQYHHSWGEVTRTTNPKGASVRNDYNGYGLLLQTTNEVNQAYTRYEYALNQYFVKAYSTVQDGLGEFYSITTFDGHGRPRATVSDHPGSSGQYRGVYNVYDSMGRQSQVSNPTEINSTWNPVGDDVVNGSNGGWRWSLQTYDWKGRPLLSTNQDGTTSSASYVGCGCSGGDTTTVIDEMGRRQKAYRDVLGRTTQTEVLKLSGGNWVPYSSTVTAYDVRNLVTGVTEYAGAVGSGGATQQTVMTYDGHGRLKTRKRPQEDAATTFDYYANDQLQHSKDARNAEGTLTYNNRGLLIMATYINPGNVAPTSAVTFQYDASGMRTEMDDGPGKVTYQYSSLNRLNSETRTFDAIANKTFTLTYGYNLAGQLTTLTDPALNTINYNRDKAGRTTSITGSPYGGVTSYASGIQYRAWGSPKAVAYGSGFSASAKFTTRMQVQEFDIPGLIGGAYTYNSDGQLNTFIAATAQSAQYDRRMDRTLGYDELGRLSSSVAGSYSFKADYSPQQDEFGNVKNASYHYWQNSDVATTFSANYQNNRVVANSVTDAGQAQTWNYDAMGNRTSIVKTINGAPTTVESINVDAIGRGVVGGVILDGQGQPSVVSGNYHIRSTVFGGEIVTTVDPSGNKTAGRVLDGGSLLAEQIKFSDGTTTVRWHHRDPLNLVARDAEPGQIKRKVHAVTPNGAQIETNDGINMGTYYACLFGGNNNPTCTGYNPQAAAAYGGLANQANGLLAAGMKVDGVLTSKSLSDIARQIQRTGNGSILLSTSLFGTPMGASIGVTAGSWQKREAWHNEYSWGKDGLSTNTTAVDDATIYDWVPGGGQEQKFSEPERTAEGLKKWAIENYNQQFNACLNSLTQGYIDKQPKRKQAELLAKLKKLKPFELSNVNIISNLTAQEIIDKYKVGIIRDGVFRPTPAESLGGTVDVGKNAFIIPKELFNKEFEWRQWAGALKPVNNIGRSFFHEAGNLAAYYLFQDYYAFGDPQDPFGDPDSGQQVDRCVLKGVFPPISK